MGRRLLLIGIAGVVLAACGSEKSGGGEAAPAKATAAAVPRPAPPEDDAKEAKAAPAKATGRRVTGTAVAAADGGPGSEGKLELIVGAANEAARGTLEFGGRTIALEGVFDGEHLRLWAASGAGDPGAIRRGYVLGRPADGGAFAGDFALSDSGGAWSARGTWETAD